MLLAFGTKAIILHGYIYFSIQHLLNRIDNKVTYLYTLHLYSFKKFCKVTLLLVICIWVNSILVGKETKGHLGRAACQV